MYDKKIKVIAFLFVAFSSLACNDDPNFPAGSVKGFRPIYASQSNFMVNFLPARSVQKPGKILRYANYLLVNDIEKGIHFFDNTDLTSPKPLGFLPINGNVDFSVKDNVLYADNEVSVIALDVENLQNIQVVSRTVIWPLIVPAESGHYFECVDTAKGPVVSWEKVDLKDPRCYRKKVID